MSERFEHPSTVPGAQRVIRRLCELQNEVWNAISDGQDPADCFCGEGGFWPLHDPSDYRNQERAIDFIVAATRAALAREER